MLKPVKQLPTITKTYLPGEISTLYLVGVGGTGSYLAQSLAKLVAGYQLDLEVVLVDPDAVEEKNIFRQNFHAYEIGLPKAEALSLRLNQQFGTSFSFYVGDGVSLLTNSSSYRRLVVTCVDSVAVRRKVKEESLWLDTGNGRDFGQVIFGTTGRVKALKKVQKEWTKTPHVEELPSPKRKCGAWSEEEQQDVAPSCADMTFFSEQGVFINEWSASAALNILFQILVKGQVSTPAIYFNCEQGRMSPASITQEYLLN